MTIKAETQEAIAYGVKVAASSEDPTVILAKTLGGAIYFNITHNDFDEKKTSEFLADIVSEILLNIPDLAIHFIPALNDRLETN